MIKRPFENSDKSLEQVPGEVSWVKRRVRTHMAGEANSAVRPYHDLTTFLPVRVCLNVAMHFQGYVASSWCYH